MEEKDLIFSILGMHRSETSCLSGILQEQGVYFGKVNTSCSFNKKGTRENAKIFRLHQDILKYNNITWYNISNKNQLNFSKLHLETRNNIIKEFLSSNKKVAFKDPRTLLLLNFWKDININYIGIIRSPISVANSLYKRKMFINNIEQGLSLWRAYNERLLAYRESKFFPIVNFDNKNFLEQVRTAFKFYNITTKDINFFDKDLIHNNKKIDLKQLAGRRKIKKIWIKLQEFCEEKI